MTTFQNNAYTTLSKMVSSTKIAIVAAIALVNTFKAESALQDLTVLHVNDMHARVEPADKNVGVHIWNIIYSFVQFVSF